MNKSRKSRYLLGITVAVILISVSLIGCTENGIAAEDDGSLDMMAPVEAPASFDTTTPTEDSMLPSGEEEIQVPDDGLMVTNGVDLLTTDGSDELLTDGSDSTMIDGSDELLTDGSDSTMTDGSNIQDTDTFVF
ncbi:MAG: hypothetical protein ACQ5SW_01665 [Sphaerochaetaceae bacterium]